METATEISKIITTLFSTSSFQHVLHWFDISIGAAAIFLTCLLLCIWKAKASRTSLRREHVVQFYIDLHKCFVVMFYFAAIAAVGLIRLAVMKHGERWGPTSLIHVHLFLVALTIPALILTVVWNGVRRPKKHPKAVKAFLVLFVCVLVTGLWLRSYAPST